MVTVGEVDCSTSLISSILDHIARQTNDACLLMELYSEISRLALTEDEKTTLCVYFTKNPAQKEDAVTVLSVYGDDNARIRYLRGLVEPEAGNDFVTQVLGT